MSELTDLIADLREKEALELVEQMLAAGEDPSLILEEARKALDIVGERYEKNTYFIPDLIFSGEIMARVARMVKPKLQSAHDSQQHIGKFLIGTVEGDIHDIGKDIVAFLLEMNGFEVKDLGVDVPKASFVKAIEEFQPDIIGISGLLTNVFDDIRDTIKAIDDSGLRAGRKIIIGGGQMDDSVREHTNADSYTTDGGAGVQQCLNWMGGK
ncbi:MAG: cobalamin-dependent protein [Desulfobacterales bacterium]|jgi:5-methyltetrahydrofolate--homocysteine methyltransferase